MASINHGVLGIHSSARGLAGAGWVWASLQQAWEIWGIPICLVGLFKRQTFAGVFLGWEFLGAERWDPLLTLPHIS